MGTTDRKVDRAERRGRQMVSELGRELREARVAAGLSQATVGRAAGLSRSRVSRIERGHVPRIPLLTLARLLGVVGLELSARAFATGQPIRDRAHLDLLERLRLRLGPGLGWQVEVPLRVPGDQRSWDALITCTASRIGAEAETRAIDVQALTRRVALKKRDGGVDRVLLLFADTRWNRALVREHRESFRASFPVDGRSALEALAAGRAPDGDALVLL